MKKLILVLLAISTLFACNETNKTKDNSDPETTNNDSKSENPVTNEEPTSIMLGTWNGDLGDKKLSVVVEKINNTELTAYKILDSDRRPLTGTFTDGDWDQPCTKAFEAVLKEPGDKEGDGVFTIKFVGYEDELETEMGPECKGNLKGVEALGEWKPNNSDTSTDFQLIKQK